MKVFISWSGPTSKRVALVLKEWLSNVLQTLDPYVSSEDIDKGARWGSDIAAQLGETNFGILCLTPDNLNSTWINFEAGALSKAVDIARVSPFLHGVKKTDVKPPLGLFQATDATKEDALLLVKSLNTAAGSPIADTARLHRAVDRWWPDLEQALAAIPSEQEPTDPARRASQRNERDMLEELLSLVRTMSRDVGPPTVRKEQLPVMDPGSDFPLNPPRFDLKIPSLEVPEQFRLSLQHLLQSEGVKFHGGTYDDLTYKVQVNRFPRQRDTYRRLAREAGIRRLLFQSSAGSLILEEEA